MELNTSGKLFPCAIDIWVILTRRRFSAFDEPWKIRYNEKGKEWEDKWGLMDVNRNLKDGVTIPDCGGQTIS